MAQFQPVLFVVDDEAPAREFLSRFAQPLGFDVRTFSDGNEALGIASRQPPDVAILDLHMPSIGGLAVLREIKLRAPTCEVVLLTGAGSISSAVEAIKLGATDYLSKPPDLPRLKELLTGIHQEVLRRRQVDAIEDDLIKHVRFHGMIGRGPLMMELFSMIRRIAPHFSTALITGETGSGKELVARALHAQSDRRDRPFVAVNCSAIVESLFESELFGHVKGAFTGASDTRTGFFERAHGGVIFLDEIGELPLPVQAKLLRVLEDGQVTKVGASETRRVDVRTIAATNRNLEREVREGRFRSDLFYRLHIVDVNVPPLRHRRDDIPLLTRAFCHQFSQRFRRPIRGMTPQAERWLLEHEWPGNVRELKNVLERACMLATGQFIGLEDLASRSVATEPEEPLPPSTAQVRSIATLEKAEIVRALEATGGNKNQAARQLGISRRALYRRLDKLGLAEIGGHAAPRHSEEN